MYPEGTISPSGGIAADILCKGRDYLVSSGILVWLWDFLPLDKIVFFSVALQYHSNDTFEGNGLNLKQLFSTAKLVQPLEIAYSYEQGRGGGIY